MPQTYIVTIKDGVSKDEFKKHIESVGGSVTHDYSLIHALAVSIPDEHYGTLDSHPDVKAIEKDQEVTTQ